MNSHLRIGFGIGFLLFIAIVTACFVVKIVNQNDDAAINLQPIERNTVPLAIQITRAQITDVTDLTAQKYTVIGKWMINTSKQPNYPADWISQSYPDPSDGNIKKALVEPINIMIIDRVSKTEQEAIEKIDSETKKAGYLRWILHSAGYKAFIFNDYHWQLFNGGLLNATCYQTKSPFEPNNHGRIFGPVRVNDFWLFTAAFSREKLGLFTGKVVTHDYVSFLYAATDFADQMNNATEYKLKGKIALNNIIKRSDQFVGDHDGCAIILERKY
ncbi:MAG: hypothetical protein WCP79_08145 [Bacillota bacterium]